MKMPRGIIASALWVAAFSLMSFGTADSIRDQYSSPSLAWGVFLALIALVPTGWAILERVTEDHEVDVERIAEVVDALHEARNDVSHLH